MLHLSVFTSSFGAVAVGAGAVSLYGSVVDPDP
jgi:hypothetical protein